MRLTHDKPLDRYPFREFIGTENQDDLQHLRDMHACMHVSLCARVFVLGGVIQQGRICIQHTKDHVRAYAGGSVPGGGRHDPGGASCYFGIPAPQVRRGRVSDPSHRGVASSVT